MPKLTLVAHILRRFVASDWGGSESAVYHLCHKLQEQGIDSPIYCTDMLSEPGENHYRGIIVKRFKYFFPWFFLNKQSRRKMVLKGGNPLSFSPVWQLLREKKLSLIHTHVQRRLGGTARTVAKLRGIPYVGDSLWGGGGGGQLEWGKYQLVARALDARYWMLMLSSASVTTSIER